MVKIPKKLLENFLLSSSISGTVHEVLIKVHSGKTICGKCMSFQYAMPKRIKLIKEDGNVHFIDLDAIVSISILGTHNTNSQKIAKNNVDYLKVVDKKLPKFLGLE